MPHALSSSARRRPLHPPSWPVRQRVGFCSSRILAQPLAASSVTAARVTHSTRTVAASSTYTPFPLITCLVWNRGSLIHLLLYALPTPRLPLWAGWRGLLLPLRRISLHLSFCGQSAATSPPQHNPSSSRHRSARSGPSTGTKAFPRRRLVYSRSSYRREVVHSSPPQGSGSPPLVGTRSSVRREVWRALARVPLLSLPSRWDKRCDTAGKLSKTVVCSGLGVLWRVSQN